MAVQKVPILLYVFAPIRTHVTLDVLTAGHYAVCWLHKSDHSVCTTFRLVGPSTDIWCGISLVIATNSQTETLSPVWHVIAKYPCWVLPSDL